jgi:peptide/nickel transport system ATP-binding protein
MEPLLSIRDLCVEYHTACGDVVALPGFSLDIMPGESFGLVGESGCGKTTLHMAIMGYLGRNGAITRGRILFEGRDLVKASAAELQAIRGARISIVYQEPASALNPTMTIGRQLMEVPIQHRRTSQEEAHALAVRVLADVNMPDPESVMGRYPHQLSGGQKQRVVIAMALLANPALLLLDEPTTGLDVTVEATVLDLINELRKKYRTALFYISHNLGVIAKVCERIGVMYCGELVEQAPAAALFKTPRHPYTKGLLACVPRLGSNKAANPLIAIPGRVPSLTDRPRGCSFANRCIHVRAGICDADPIPFYEVGPGHKARCARWGEIEDMERPLLPVAGRAGTGGKPVLVAQELSKVYELGRARLRANDDLNLVAERARVLAIVGESGSGKSTFASVVTGLQSASKGRLYLNGDDIARKPVSRRTPDQVAAIQMVFQNPDGTLNPSHTVGWPLARALKRFGLVRDKRVVEERVKALLDLVCLPAAIRHRRPRQLSGGQKQRVAIARAFAGNPQLIVADEPVAALDVSVQAAIVNLLLQIQAEHATTLVFISHDLALVRYLADHVVVMYLGRVMESAPVAALFAPPYHPYTEALLSAVPVPDPTVQQKRIRLEGEIPSPLNVPRGCRFAGRCPRKLGPICDEQPPPEQQAGPDHTIACHIPLDVLRRVEPIFEMRSPRPAALQTGVPPNPS